LWRMLFRMQNKRFKCKMEAKKVSLISVFLLLSMAGFAQWECPSRIGGNLKTISFLPENLTWAAELTTSAGYAGTDGVANAMAFMALDYSQNRYTFYVEGGIKSWIKGNSNGYHNEKFSYGLREAFYKYRGNSQTLTIGLQSTQGEDHYLLNERLLGINYRQTLGNWSLNALTGTVQERYARNGTFCTLGYLYNIVPGRERSVIGHKIGQTNPALLTLSYHPKAKSNDEFSGNEEFGSTPEKLFKLNTIGGLLYHEYGSLIETPALFSGIYAETEIAGLTFKPELILQSASSNHALLYSLTLQKQISWSNKQQTKFYVRYLGLLKIDSTATTLNSFSNVFAGEVLRMDAIELPLLQVGLKHSIPTWKASIKLQAALQTGQTDGYVSDPYNPVLNNDRMQEYDLVLSKNVGKNLLVNAYMGYLVYPRMAEPYVYETNRTLWGKIEMRLTF
jgi:hypothetical protein